MMMWKRDVHLLIGTVRRDAPRRAEIEVRVDQIWIESGTMTEALEARVAIDP
jgi:hypothetical protein